MSEQQSNQQETQQRTTENPQQPAQTAPETPQNQAANLQNPQQSQPQTNQQSQPQTNQQSQRSSSDIEAENRALRAILGAHVEGMNIDEELEFVGPTGKYRPQAQPQQQQQPETRTSRRQSVSNTRSEEPQQVDVAAIDKQFDEFMRTAYGFDFSESQDA